MPKPPRPIGRYFEEMAIGDSAESPGRTVTESDLVTFAGLSGDYNQLHTDAEFAKDALFGERIAHGLLGLSIASGLASRTGFIEGTTQAFTGLEWKFCGPIKIGDTVRTRLEVKRKKTTPRLGGGFVYLEVSVFNQHDDLVQQGVWKVLIKSVP